MNPMKLIAGLILAASIPVCVMATEQTDEASGTSQADRECTICGAIKERFLFWMWSRMAPSPDPSNVAGYPLIEPVEFVTADNKTLAGYRYLAHDRSRARIPAKGYVLMAMGNAMIADQIIPHLSDLAASGYDVYVYDYRGYGNSEGKRRINAIIEDYKELAISLNEQYDHKVLYGTSLGGAVIMNVLGAGIDFDRAVVDASPSKFSPYGCPARIDPVANIPDDPSGLLVITGARDSVLNDGMTAPLRETVERRGGTTVHGEAFAHPFMDSPQVHDRRMALVRRFITTGQL